MTDKADRAAGLEPESKRCNTCGKVRPIDDFYRRPGGRLGKCGSCMAEDRKARRKAENEAEPDWAVVRAALAWGKPRVVSDDLPSLWCCTPAPPTSMAG